VVWRADRDVASRFQLFSRPLDGSAPPVELNAPLQPVIRFALAAGDRIVYLADGLFVVPADGSAAPVELSGQTSVFDFALDSTRTHVVYRNYSSRTFGGTNTLYVVPVDGSAAPAALASGTSIDGFWIGPDGTVVYGLMSAEGERAPLFAVPLDGSAPPLLLTWSDWPLWYTIHPFRTFAHVQFTPDGTRVVYSDVNEDEYGRQTYSLCSVPLDASAAKADLWSSYSGEFSLTASSPNRVLFRGGGQVYSCLPD